MSKTTLLTTAKELKHKLFIQKVNWERQRKARAIRNSTIEQNCQATRETTDTNL